MYCKFQKASLLVIILAFLSKYAKLLIPLLWSQRHSVYLMLMYERNEETI